MPGCQNSSPDQYAEISKLTSLATGSTLEFFATNEASHQKLRSPLIVEVAPSVSIVVVQISSSHEPLAAVSLKDCASGAINIPRKRGHSRIADDEGVLRYYCPYWMANPKVQCQSLSAQAF